MDRAIRSMRPGDRLPVSPYRPKGCAVVAGQMSSVHYPDLCWVAINAPGMLPTRTARAPSVPHPSNVADPNWMLTCFFVPYTSSSIHPARVVDSSLYTGCLGARATLRVVHRAGRLGRHQGAL